MLPRLCLSLCLCFTFACAKPERQREDAGAADFKSELQIEGANKTFLLNNLLQGKWAGKCGQPEVDKATVVFKNNIKIEYRYSLAGGSAELPGVTGPYEMIDQDTIRLLYMRPERQKITVEVVNDDEIKLTNLIGLNAACFFKRVK